MSVGKPTEAQLWALRALAAGEGVLLTVYVPSRGRPVAWIWRRPGGQAALRVWGPTVEVLRRAGWLELQRETTREWEYRISDAGRAAVTAMGGSVQGRMG